MEKLIILLQIPVLAFAWSKGAGSIYLDMTAVLIVIILGSAYLSARVYGNKKILLYSLMLLSVGTMLQCIFIEENILKNPETYSRASGVITLQVQYLIGFAAALLMSVVYYKWDGISSMKVCRLLFLASSAISLLTLVFAASMGGVRNWIRIGPLSIQTTEITKVIYLFLAAGLLGTSQLPSARRIRAFYLVTAVQAGFLALQGEYGTLLLILLVFFALHLLFVPESSLFIKTFTISAALLTCIVVTANHFSRLAAAHSFAASNPLLGAFLKVYDKIANRFIYWMHPEKDPLGLGYQLIKARESVMLGGWFGTGSVTDLPVKTSDLVYPALIQRCGMVFALLVFLIFILFWLEGMRLFVRKEDRYHQVLAAGIVIMFFLQTIIIIAGSTGLCPLTGITLPFISKGGSSLLVSFVMTGILITISGKVQWKGVNDEETEEFFKESPALAKHWSGISHTCHAFFNPHVSDLSRAFDRGRPGQGQGKAENL